MTVREVPRSVRLPVDVDERLSRLSAATGRSKSFYMRELVEQGLDDLEYTYGLVARAEAIRAGTRDTVPLDEVLAQLGLTHADLDAVPDETGDANL